MLRVLELYFQNEKYKVYPHPVPQTEEREPLKVLISGASCKSAESLSYGIIKGTTFGTDLPIILSLFEMPGKSFQYAVSLACELSISGFGLLKDVIPTDDPETAFKDADVAILLNPEYTEKSNREKLNYYFRLYKNLGISLHKYSKKTVKVILAGEMRVECSMICSQFAESIPVENITGLSRHIATRAYNTIAENLKPEYKNIYGIHIWGMNRPDIASATVDELIDSPTPETRFFKKIGNQTINMYTAVKDYAAHEKDLSEGVETLKWIKYAITKDTQFYRKCNDNWIGSAICQHLKDWWNGTEHPVSMIVCSDGSHNIPKGLFVSFPVKIDSNKTWKILQDVKIDTHTAVELEKDTKYLNFIRAQIKIYMYKEEIKLLIEKRFQDDNIIRDCDKYPICANLKK